MIDILNDSSFTHCRVSWRGYVRGEGLSSDSFTTLILHHFVLRNHIHGAS